MIELTEDHLRHLKALCEQYEVRQLELFGSAATEAFETDRSDLDVLVAFHPKATLPAEDRYFGLLHGLEDLFQRPIDLVDIAAARNPFFIANALKHRVKLYAA